MRNVILLLALAAAASSQASYELALLVDETNQVIQRYDVTNRVALGSFGLGNLGFYTGARLSLDPTTPNEVAVLNAEGIINRLNFHTGQLTSSINLTGLVNNIFGNTPWSLDVAPDGTYMVQGFTSAFQSEIRRYSRTGTQIGGTIALPSSSAFMDLVVGSDNSTYAIVRNNVSGGYQYDLRRYNSSGVLTGNMVNLFGGTSADFNALNSIEITGNQLTLVGGGQASPVQLYGTFGSLTTPSAGSWISTGIFHSAMPDHVGRTFFLQSWDNAGTSATRLYVRNNTGLNAYRPYADLPYNVGISSGVMVLAPEPGTMIALGAGVAWFLRRRAKRSA